MNTTAQVHNTSNLDCFGLQLDCILAQLDFQTWRPGVFGGPSDDSMGFMSGLGPNVGQENPRSIQESFLDDFDSVPG